MQANTIKIVRPGPANDKGPSIAYVSKGEHEYGIACTEPFPVNVKPAVSGFYYTHFIDFMGDENEGWAYFDAESGLWGPQFHDLEEAAKKGNTAFSNYAYKWFGLTVNPDHLYPYTSPAQQELPLETPATTTADEDDEL